MEVDELIEYELKLLIEAITVSLTKEKRKRGECGRIDMISPITKVPDYFKDVKGDLKL